MNALLLYLLNENIDIISSSQQEIPTVVENSVLDSIFDIRDIFESYILSTKNLLLPRSIDSENVTNFINNFIYLNIKFTIFIILFGFVSYSTYCIGYNCCVYVYNLFHIITNPIYSTIIGTYSFISQIRNNLNNLIDNISSNSFDLENHSLHDRFMNWVCDLVFGPVSDSDSETNSARSSSTTLTYDENIIENINFEDVDENINVEPNYRLESDNTIRYVQELIILE